jgi:phosphatidylserine decarboxylase
MRESSADVVERSGGDELFALLQRALPQQWLSRGMHALARSRQRPLRNALIRTVLRSYPQIDMHEALQPDPFVYESFNAFFTRELRPGVRPVADDPQVAVSPVDGTVSQLGRTDAGKLVQAKGMDYTCDALLADTASAARYVGGSFSCLYLAPYNYHRIHMPLDGVLRAARYVPGRLFSVNASTARAVPQLFARNERVVCDFDTDHGPLGMVLVGALFVGSIETVFAGEINPPPGRGGVVRTIEAGIGRRFARGEELGRFNMGSTVIVLFGEPAAFMPRIGPGEPVRMGQPLARFGT